MYMWHVCVLVCVCVLDVSQVVSWCFSAVLSLTTRMVLDGWPLTMSQVELMKKHHILPAMFVALQVSEEECTRRAERESSQPSRYRGWTGAMGAWYTTCTYTTSRRLGCPVLQIGALGSYSLQLCVSDTSLLHLLFSCVTRCTYVRTHFMWCLPLFSVGPLHNSAMAHTMRAQAYLRHSAEVRQWYEVQHRNWHCVDGEGSRWKVWESTSQLVAPRLKEIQLYIDQIPQGEE